MAVLERGGNAFDAAVAAGFTLQVVEPHLNGPGGDLPAVFWSAERGEPLVLCAQGVSPAAATIERFRELGHGLVPGTGVLAACVPGAFGGWLLLLRDFGTWRLEDVLEFAIGYAEHGYPVVPGITATIDRVEPLLREWPASAELYLPGAGARNALPQRASSPPRIDGFATRRAAARVRTRSSARASSSTRASSRTRSTASAPRTAASSPATTWPCGARSLEAPVTYDYAGYTVCKTGAVGTGPGLPAAARAPRGLRPRGHEPRPSSCTRSPSAPSSRSPTATRCTATPTSRSTACCRTVQRRAAEADRRRSVVRAPARPRPDAAARRGGGDPRLRRADARARHRPRRRRRPFRQPRLGDAERRLARRLADHPGARLAARDARPDVLAGGRAALVPRARASGRGRRSLRDSLFAEETRTSPSAPRAATSRTSGRCTCS